MKFGQAYNSDIPWVRSILEDNAMDDTYGLIHLGETDIYVFVTVCPAYYFHDYPSHDLAGSCIGDVLILSKDMINKKVKKTKAQLLEEGIEVVD